MKECSHVLQTTLQSLLQDMRIIQASRDEFQEKINSLIEMSKTFRSQFSAVVGPLKQALDEANAGCGEADKRVQRVQLVCSEISRLEQALSVSLRDALDDLRDEHREMEELLASNDVEKLPINTSNSWVVQNEQRAKELGDLQQELQDQFDTFQYEPGSYWAAHLPLLQEILANSEPATMWTLGDAYGDEEAQHADVWRATSESFDHLIKQNTPLQKPLLIPAPVGDTVISTRPSDLISKFFGRVERQKPQYIDVQDLSQPEEAHGNCAAAWETARVMSKLRFPQDPNNATHPPINLLNLDDIMRSPKPPFLRHDRFNLIPLLHGRLHNDVGKPTTSPHPIDLFACSSFNLFAQRGAISGFHVDALNGTWVQVLAGLKAWTIVPSPTPADLLAFARLGDKWPGPPGRVRTVLLGPGDVLVMPPGVLVPHAPVTVRDCLIQGGQFWDERAVVGVLKNVRGQTVGRPNTTNEPVPRQLPEILGALGEYVRDYPERFVVEGMTEGEVGEVVGEVVGALLGEMPCACRICGRWCPCRVAGRGCGGECHGGRGGNRKCVGGGRG